MAVDVLTTIKCLFGSEDQTMSCDNVDLLPGKCRPDLQAYDRFVDTSPQGILFCHTWWLDAVAPGRYQILTVERGGAIQAAWPVVVSQEAAGPRVGMPELTQKLGILFAPSDAKYAERLSDEHRLIEQLIGRLPEGCAVDQNFHERFTNWLPFYWKGFSQTTRYTYLIENLGDLDGVWANLRTNARRVIRKAMKEGVRLKETDDLECFYNIHMKTFQRQGMENPYSLHLLARIDSAVGKHAGRKAFVAEDSAGRPHACEYLVYDERCAISLLRGADPALRGSGASALLEWEAVQFASTVSKVFDFEGSMIQGVEVYLRDFGAVQTPYFCISRSAQVKPAPPPPSSRVRHLAGRVLRKMARIIDPC
jgi:hypothetical protein